MRSGSRGFPTFGQGAMVALLVAGVQLAVTIVGFIGIVVLREKHLGTVILFAALLGAGVSAVLVLNWASAVRREPPWLLVVPKPVAPVLLVLALVVTFGADIVASQIFNWVRWLFPPGPFFHRLMSPYLQGNLLLVLACVMVVGPVSEELIFRGVVLRGFLENYRAWVAILLSSLLFTLMHMNPWQGVSGFFLGCLFAWFVARTGSLLPAITGHVLTNGLVVVAMRSQAGVSWMTTEGFHPWWLTALGVFVTAGGIVAFHRATRAARDAGAGEPVASL